MKITKNLLKEMIAEEIAALDEAKDPQRLKESAYAMKLLIRLNQALSTVQGGGRPPRILIKGESLFNWLVRNSGYSADEISSEARKMQDVK
jgi:hypothetical protein